MSAPLDKTTLTRAAWITALRQQGDRQCTHAWSDGRGNVCAVGLLGEVAGVTSYVKAREVVGLSACQMDEIVFEMNDTGSSFAEIADTVAGWFPS